MFPSSGTIHGEPQSRLLSFFPGAAPAGFRYNEGIAKHLGPSSKIAMDKKKLPHDFVLLVCTRKDGKCYKKGSKLRHRLRDEIDRLGLGKRIRLLPSGCVGACNKGPVVVSSPGQTLWTRVRKRDARLLIEELAGQLPDRNERNSP